jgi:hypothetical protein
LIDHGHSIGPIEDIVTDRHVGQKIRALIVTTVQTNHVVTETEHSQETQDSLTLVHSILTARSPIYGLPSPVAH